MGVVMENKEDLGNVFMKIRRSNNTTIVIFDVKKNNTEFIDFRFSEIANTLKAKLQKRLS